MTATNEARSFMARWFSMGLGSSLTSHEPHVTLKGTWGAYLECREHHWIKVEPYNKFGSIRITATEKGRQVAQEHMRARCAEMFAETGTTPPANGQEQAEDGR